MLLLLLLEGEEAPLLGLVPLLPRRRKGVRRLGHGPGGPGLGGGPQAGRPPGELLFVTRLQEEFRPAHQFEPEDIFLLGVVIGGGHLRSGEVDRRLSAESLVGRGPVALGVPVEGEGRASYHHIHLIPRPIASLLGVGLPLVFADQRALQNVVLPGA